MEKKSDIDLFFGETEIISLGWKSGFVGCEKGGMLLINKRISAIRKERTLLGLLIGASYTVLVGLESIDSFEYGKKSRWLWRLLQIKIPIEIVERNLLSSRRILTI